MHKLMTAMKLPGACCRCVLRLLQAVLPFLLWAQKLQPWCSLIALVGSSFWYRFQWWQQTPICNSWCQLLWSKGTRSFDDKKIIIVTIKNVMSWKSFISFFKLTSRISCNWRFCQAMRNFIRVFSVVINRQPIILI